MVTYGGLKRMESFHTGTMKWWECDLLYSKDLVVVIASEVMSNARDRWELIVKYILHTYKTIKFRYKAV